MVLMNEEKKEEAKKDESKEEVKEGQEKKTEEEKKKEPKTEKEMVHPSLPHNTQEQLPPLAAPLTCPSPSLPLLLAV